MHVDAQHLAEQGVGVLGVAGRVSGRAAVARGDVEIAVRAKAHPAGVVLAGRVPPRHNQRLGRDVGGVGTGRGARVLPHLGRAGRIDHVHIEFAVAGVVRIEGQAQQALLAGRPEVGVGQVQERRRQLPVCGQIQDVDLAGVLLDDEQLVRIPRRRGREDGAGQGHGDLVHVDDAGIVRHIGRTEAVEDIVAGSAGQGVGAKSPGHHVVERGPRQLIVAGAAGDSRLGHEWPPQDYCWESTLNGSARSVTGR